ncbi:DinB/UmuC family translesion DNA polymerase [Fodinibius salicampi]
MELNGKPCLEIEHINDPRKGIMTSRSFGKAVTKLEDLQEAIAEFIMISTEKLRLKNRLPPCCILHCVLISMAMVTQNINMELKSLFTYLLLTLLF